MFFIQRLTFILMSRFYIFNVFLFLFKRFFSIYGINSLAYKNIYLQD